MEKYVEQTVAYLKELTAIDSPSGYTRKATAYLCNEFAKMDIPVTQTKKGAVLVDMGGAGKKVAIAAHVDTLGALVRSIKPNGRMRLALIGGYEFHTIDGENCTVYTRDGRSYTGVVLNTLPSVHVDKSPERIEPNMEILLDEDVKSKEDVKALGIDSGDVIAFDPRTTVTATGYIKSRYLDDKLCASMLLTLAKAIKAGELTLGCHLYLYFTTYEEVGHGCASGLPLDLDVCISADMGCVGADLNCTERDVSISCMDGSGPYDYDLITDLVNVAKEKGLSYAIDYYPRYGSDVDVALRSGYDIAHGCIGPGVYASHNYERSHKEGVKNTLGLLIGYLCQ